MSNLENIYLKIVEEAAKKNLDPLPLLLSQDDPLQILQTIKQIKPTVGFFGGLGSGLKYGALDIIERLSRLASIPVEGSERPRQLEELKHGYLISEESPITGKVGFTIGSLLPYAAASIAMPKAQAVLPILIGASEAQRIYEAQPPEDKSIGRAVAAGAVSGALTALPIHRVSKILTTPAATSLKTIATEAGIGAVSFPIISTLMQISSQLGTEGKINLDVLDTYFREQAPAEVITGGLLGGITGALAGRMPREQRQKATMEELSPKERLVAMKNEAEAHLKSVLKEVYPEASDAINEMQIKHPIIAKLIGRGVTPEEMNNFIMEMGEKLGLVTTREESIIPPKEPQTITDRIHEQWTKFINERERAIKDAIEDLKSRGLVSEQEIKDVLENQDLFRHRNANEPIDAYREAIKKDVFDYITSDVTTVEAPTITETRLPSKLTARDEAYRKATAIEHERNEAVKSVIDDMYRSGLLSDAERKELIGMADTFRLRKEGESFEEYANSIRRDIIGMLEEEAGRIPYSVEPSATRPLITKPEKPQPDLLLERERNRAIKLATDDLVRRRVIFDTEQQEFLNMADIFRLRREGESFDDYVRAIRDDIANIISEEASQFPFYKNVNKQWAEFLNEKTKALNKALDDLVNRGLLGAGEREAIMTHLEDFRYRAKGESMKDYINSLQNEIITNIDNLLIPKEKGIGRKIEEEINKRIAERDEAVTTALSEQGVTPTPEEVKTIAELIDLRKIGEDKETYQLKVKEAVKETAPVEEVAPQVKTTTVKTSKKRGKNRTEEAPPIETIPIKEETPVIEAATAKEEIPVIETKPRKKRESKKVTTEQINLLTKEEVKPAPAIEETPPVAKETPAVETITKEVTKPIVETVPEPTVKSEKSVVEAPPIKVTTEIKSEILNAQRRNPDTGIDVSVYGAIEGVETGTSTKEIADAGFVNTGRGTPLHDTTRVGFGIRALDEIINTGSLPFPKTIQALYKALNPIFKKYESVVDVLGLKEKGIRYVVDRTEPGTVLIELPDHNIFIGIKNGKISVSNTKADVVKNIPATREQMAALDNIFGEPNSAATDRLRAFSLLYKFRDSIYGKFLAEDDPYNIRVPAVGAASVIDSLMPALKYSKEEYKLTKPLMDTLYNLGVADTSPIIKTNRTINTKLFDSLSQIIDYIDTFSNKPNRTAPVEKILTSLREMIDGMADFASGVVKDVISRMPQSEFMASRLNLSHWYDKDRNRIVIRWGSDKVAVLGLDGKAFIDYGDHNKIYEYYRILDSGKSQINPEVADNLIKNILSIKGDVESLIKALNVAGKVANYTKAKIALDIGYEKLPAVEAAFNRDEFIRFANESVKRILGSDNVEVIISETPEQFFNALKKYGISDTQLREAFSRHGSDLEGKVPYGATVKLPNLMTLIFVNEFPHSKDIIQMRRTVIHEIAEALLMQGKLSEKDIAVLKNKFGGRGRHWSEEFADALADYINNKDLTPRGADEVIKRIFDTIGNIVEGIRNFFAGHGFRTAEGIIRSIAEGKYAEKEPTGGFDPITVAFRIGKETNASVEEILKAYDRYMERELKGIRPVTWLSKWFAMPQWSNHPHVREIFRRVNDANASANEMIQVAAYPMLTKLQAIKSANPDMYKRLNEAVIVSGELEMKLPDWILKEKFKLDDKAIEAYKSISEATNEYLRYYCETMLRHATTLASNGSVFVKTNIGIDQILNLVRKAKATGDLTVFDQIFKTVQAEEGEASKLRPATERDVARARTALIKAASVADSLLHAADKMFYFPRIREGGNYAISVIEKHPTTPSKYVETWRIHTSGNILTEKKELKEILNNLTKKSKKLLTIDAPDKIHELMPEHDTIVVYERVRVHELAPAISPHQKIILIEKLPRENIPLIERMASTALREGILGVIDKVKERLPIPEETIDRIGRALLHEIESSMYQRSFAKTRMIQRLEMYKSPRRLIESIPELDEMISQLKVVKGYKEDALDALSEYAVKEAQAISRIKAATNIHIYSAIANLGEYIAKDSRFGEWYDRYLKATLAPMSDAMRAIQPLKTMATVWYLGFRLSSGLMQLAQIFTVGVPELARFIKAPLEDITLYQRKVTTKDYLLSQGKAINMLTRAVMDLISKRLTTDEMEALESPIAKSKTETRFYSELLAETTKSERILSPLINASMLVFRYFEQLSREGGFLAAYRLARERGLNHDTALNFASQYTDNAFFIFSRANKPLIAIGDTGLTAAVNLSATLRGYVLNYLGWVYKALNDKYGKSEADKVMMSFAYTTLLGGLAATPFISDILDTISKLTGVPLKQKIIYSISKDKDIRRAAEYGIFAPMGIDISASLGLDLLPKELSFVGLADYLFGVYRGAEKKATIMADMLKAGEYWRATEAMLPTGLEKLSASIRHSVLGQPLTTTFGRTLTDEYGRPMKLTETEAFMQALGFRPTTMSEGTSKHLATKEVETRMMNKRNNIYLAYKLADSPEELSDVMKRVEEYNREAAKYGGAIPKITPQSLRRVKKEATEPTAKIEILRALGY